MPLLRFLLSLFASFSFSLATLDAGSGPETADFEARLEALAAELERVRAEAHIPGLSVAVVHEGRVVLARGFGFAELESERPADEHTLYPIGSTTKAFTATLAGQLVDAGALEWDEPITRTLPAFDLPVRSSDPEAACTLRDLLSHRHGFARMGLLWFGGRTTREEILEAATHAEPWDDFRAGFHYSNVGFLAAGEATAVAADATWDELIHERLLAPLGMDATTLTDAPGAGEEPAATGYRWEAADERWIALERVPMGNIAPAGALQSSALDMSRWLRFQLAGGELEGQRLISAEAHRETWTPQIEIAPGVSYGLGWMLREHRGRQVVEHGGNIDGFSAQVGLFPEEELGYVVLMNLDASPFQAQSIALVFDTLFPPATPFAGNAELSEEELAAYAGTYLANFARFEDTEFTVEPREGGLRLAVPGQGTVDLALPDAEGRWNAEGAPLAVRFQTGAEGEVVGLTLDQGDFRFEVPRRGHPIPPEKSAEELEPYAGTYTRDEGGRQVEVLLERGHLVLFDRGQRLRFHAPDEEGRAPLRARPEQGATFELDAEGAALGFVFHGEAGDKHFTRKIEPAGGLPTVDELLELRGAQAQAEALASWGSARLSGTAWVAQAGVRGEMTHLLGQGAFASHLEFGRFGRMQLAVRGGEAWSYDSMRGFEVLRGERLAQALLEHPGSLEGDWRETYAAVEVLRADQLDERDVFVVRLTPADLPARTLWLDAETGDILQLAYRVLGRFGSLPLTIRFSDYRTVQGLRFPHRSEVSNPASGRTVLTIESVETGLELPPEAFLLEDPTDAQSDED